MGKTLEMIYPYRSQFIDSVGFMLNPLSSFVNNRS